MRKIVMFVIFMTLTAFTVGYFEHKKVGEEVSLNIVATTTMLADLAKTIGGSSVNVKSILQPGADPHTHQLSERNIEVLKKADVVLYNGLQLQNGMDEEIKKLADGKRTVICATEKLDRAKLIKRSGGSGYDPHVWFDVSLWKAVATHLANELSHKFPGHAVDYRKNLEVYHKDLARLDAYIRSRVKNVPKQRRVLVTAHDAFNYFGRAYGFEAIAVQGVNTSLKATPEGIAEVARQIARRKVRAIFVETSLPIDNVEALRVAAKRRGFEPRIVWDLFSDSLGSDDSTAETYILAFQANVDTIVDALE